MLGASTSSIDTFILTLSEQLPSQDFHSIVKFAIVDLLGSYLLTPEDEAVLNDVIRHFVVKNATSCDPRLTEEDEKVFVTMEGVAQRCVDHVKAEMARKEEQGECGLHEKGLVYLMLKSGRYDEKAVKEVSLRETSSKSTDESL